MKFIMLMGALFLLTSGLVQGEELENREAAKKLAESVMKLVEMGETEQAISLTKPYLIIPNHEFEAMLSSFRMQAPAMEQRFGKTIGIELIGVEEAGKSLMLIKYIQKFENHPMTWRFYFYKRKTGWVLNTFYTDDKIHLLF